MDYNIYRLPSIVSQLEEECKSVGFTMPSDRHIGSLLRTLALSKPGGLFLELGTGIGLSLAWIADGLGSESKVISIDNDPKLTSIVQNFFRGKKAIEIFCADGGEWLDNYEGEQFDLIFADAWPGKYQNLDRALEVLKVGGFYVIDDMNEAENWPEGHLEKANSLIDILDQKSNLSVTKFDWSTGVVIACKIKEE